MILLSHISYPALLFILIAKLLNIEHSFPDLLILIFFSVLPDFDFFYYKFVMKKEFDSDFQHHKWFTHWPITYLPVIVLLIFFPTKTMFLVSFGIYSHFILDTFFGGDGMMWFYPFSKKFYHFFTEKTLNRHGKYWFRAYRRLFIYKVDIAAFILLLLILILNY